MEKKRKRIQSPDPAKEATLVSGSTRQNIVKMVSYRQSKDKELNYLNKPHMLFK
ncbi:hypothetical protein [Pedobacter lusitanus]|uniref:hypothetical protein n=1 Tax=Pedobacter lusitanus TaxID=1503925 RepID=UPI001364B477|nr:hypothetical protein [Pedobacter lusitanus]